MRQHLNLTLSYGSDLTFVALRIAISTLLSWGALTKLADLSRIEELAATWTAVGLPYAQLLVTISITLQLLLAALLFIGLFARAAGLLNSVNFLIAASLSGIFAAGSDWWPFAVLVGLLLHFGMFGAGKLSVDWIRARRLAAAPLREDQTLGDLLESMGIKASAGDRNYPGSGKGGEL